MSLKRQFNRVYEKDFFALLLAAQEGDSVSASALLAKHGKDLLDEKSGDGFTALDVAMRNNHKELVVIFLRARGLKDSGGKLYTQNNSLIPISPPIPNGSLFSGLA